MNNRRKTLQTIAGLGVVTAVTPSSWIKPILSSVVLPAHAQTSSILITDEDQDGPISDQNDARALAFDGVDLSGRNFNCCNSTSVPDRNGNGLLIIDIDYFDKNGCNGPFLDLTDDVSGVNKIGDRNWEIVGLSPTRLTPGVYSFTAIRRAAPNEGVEFSMQIDFVTRSLRNESSDLDCNGDPLLSSVRGTVRVSIVEAVSGSKNLKTGVPQIIFTF